MMQAKHENGGDKTKLKSNQLEKCKTILKMEHWK